MLSFDWTTITFREALAVHLNSTDKIDNYTDAMHYRVGRENKGGEEVIGSLEGRREKREIMLRAKKICPLELKQKVSD